MKKVIMRTLYAGPCGNCHPEREIDLQDAEADGLVNGGYAEYASVASSHAAAYAEDEATATVAETSMTEQLETADAGPQRRKKG